MRQSLLEFLSRWSAPMGTERATYQLFLGDLCKVLELPEPDPAQKDSDENRYVFEHRVTIAAADGSQAFGYIDLYRRGCFVCEAKQTGKELESGGWDMAMRRAQAQAERYARALPAAEGRPPFLIVTDVGRHLELYADFTRSGATYTPFPDARSHRILLKDLEREEICERLRALWLDPMSLDPSRVSAKVTREIAARLAKLARSLEEAGHPAAATANFLMRCLFSMFAEDVGLLPTDTFTGLLRDLRSAPDKLRTLLEQLWQTMNQGGLWGRTAEFLQRFNGGLFRDEQAPLLSKQQIDLLLEAAHADWRLVEPSIFGTLLERALDPRERHKLGAHYTPRAYVERLVLPTLVEPLRADWRDALTAAVALDQQGKRKEAIAELRAFQQRLCKVRVLDPACGSGNFLYVALEHMKRLEGEVLQALAELGASGSLELEHVTVDPHQFLGLELNPRAAAIAEMVLWIGYLQWHYRTHGHVQPPEPVLREFHNIEHRDALLTWERVEPATDADGRPVMRWDGVTQKRHPVTGQPVPDETAQVAMVRYVNPKRASWPTADFVVGNPPFIGNKRLRLALGDGYVEALRDTWGDVPDTADFVMYWWHHAAELTQTGKIQRFGFITTNSLGQALNRKVMEPHLTGVDSLSLTWIVPDHPWADASLGADVRVSMTVGVKGKIDGRLLQVIDERETGEDALAVLFNERVGRVHSDLTVGAAVVDAVPLIANAGICFQGMNLVGKGFRVTADQVCTLGYDLANLPDVIKPTFHARNLMQGGDPLYVIDLFGYTIERVRREHPTLFQWLLERVKPERDQNKRESRRRNWWLFGEPVGRLRTAWQGLLRIMITPETARHRICTFIELPFCPDHKLYAICLDDPALLGVLSSRVHVLWSYQAGGRMGVGNDPVYNNTTCLLPFPFPTATPTQQTRLRELGEAIDAHRKARQAANPDLTLTGMYNVLEALRQGRPLSDKEREIHEQGLVAVLGSLHDDLDRAVLDTYGWQDLAPALVGRPGGTLPLADPPADQAAAQEELLSRLVTLNAVRAAEEAQGMVRWLRPDFQCRRRGQVTTAPAGEQAELEIPIVTTPAAASKLAWPKELKDQVRVVREAMLAGANSPEEIAALFKRGPLKGVTALLEAMKAMGSAG